MCVAAECGARDGRTACSNVAVTDTRGTENPVQNVTFPSNGGTAHGYLALGAWGRGPGVVVIQ